MRYFAALLCLCALSANAADMSHEETMVRTAYAKFAYAVQQGVIGRLAVEGVQPNLEVRDPLLTSDQRLKNAEVDFTLTDFVIGDVNDIMSQKAIDLVSLPSNEQLDTSGESGASYADEGVATRWESFELHWVPAHKFPPEVQNLTIAQVYALDWRKQWPGALWQRYASYSVGVTYQKKTVHYKALFLFGHDAKGNEMIAPQDAVTNAGALGLTLTYHLFPAAFATTRLRKVPAVANWLNATQMSDASCSVGKGDICCDLIRLKCGPGHVDLVDALSKPLPTRAEGDLQ